MSAARILPGTTRRAAVARSTALRRPAREDGIQRMQAVLAIRQQRAPRRAANRRAPTRRSGV